MEINNWNHISERLEPVFDRWNDQSLNLIIVPNSERSIVHNAHNNLSNRRWLWVLNVLLIISTILWSSWAMYYARENTQKESQIIYFKAEIDKLLNEIEQLRKHNEGLEKNNKLLSARLLGRYRENK